MMNGRDLVLIGGIDEHKKPHTSNTVIREAFSLQPRHKTLKTLDNLFHNQQQSDVTLINGSERIHLHRVVLMARNSLFRKLLSGK